MGVLSHNLLVKPKWTMKIDRNMLQVFSTSFYALLYLGSMLYFVNFLLALSFEILPKVQRDPIVVITPLGENVRTDRVYKDCSIVICGKTMCADFVELPMHDFDIILCIDCLQSCYTCMDCRCRVVRFCFPNEIKMVWQGYNSSLPNPLISNLKANKMMSKGLLCHLVSVNYLDHDIPSIESLPVVMSSQMCFLMIFLEFLPLDRLTFVSTSNPILNQFQFLLTECLQLNSKS